MIKDKTGKLSEKAFITFIESQNGHVYRFEDYYDVNKANPQQRRLAVSEKPADFLVTLQSQTSYAEAKACSKPNFPFSRIRKSQWREIPGILRAGGQYDFYLHFTSEGVWFKVPAQAILRHSKKSFNLSDLQKHPDVIQLSI